jgi:hypothetical protein
MRGVRLEDGLGVLIHKTLLDHFFLENIVRDCFGKKVKRCSKTPDYEMGIKTSVCVIHLLFNVLKRKTPVQEQMLHPYENTHLNFLSSACNIHGQNPV